VNAGKRTIRQLLTRLAIQAARLGPLEKELLNLLVTTRGTRDLRAFLRRHDYLVGMAFNRSESPRGVLAEFNLGTEVAWDFLVLGCSAAWWDVTFVHLGPAGARFFLKDGSPTQAHQDVLHQLAGCKLWTQLNEEYLRAKVAAMLAPLGLPSSPAALARNGAEELRHPRCAVSFHYCFVMGRRDPTLNDGTASHALDQALSPPPIVTYDRLLDAARRFDRADALAQASLRFWKG